MARLDRLGPAKEVAQIGAAIGREFSHSLLAAVTRKPETAINSALDRSHLAAKPRHLACPNGHYARRRASARQAGAAPPVNDVAGPGLCRSTSRATMRA